MIDISIILPPKVGTTIQAARADRDFHLGPLVLEQALRNQGFHNIHMYDQSNDFNEIAMIFEFDRRPDFEDYLFGHDDVEACIEASADQIEDSDLYLISMYLPTHTSGIKLAQRLKQEHLDGRRRKKGYIIVGGTSVAETTERILAIDAIDAACYGYGEDTVTQIAHFVNASNGNGNLDPTMLSVVPNLYVRGEDGNFQVTPWSLPSGFVSVPRQRLAEEAARYQAKRVAVQGSYGCLWSKCKYCYLASKPRHYLKRDMSEIVQDIDAIGRMNGISTISILDEGFLLRIEEFLSASNGMRAPRMIDINARPEQVIKYRDQLEKLIKEFPGEIIGLYMGTETFDPAVLEQYHRGVDMRQTRDAVSILRNLAKKYPVKFDFHLGFFLWSQGQTVEGLLKGIKLWEQFTGGECSPADLLKIERYNIFTTRTIGEKTIREFDNEMTPEERTLAVMYPYGRPVNHQPFRDIYNGFSMGILPFMPMMPHETHCFQQLLSSEIQATLNGYGRRLMRFPYETALRLHLSGAPEQVSDTVMTDMRALFQSAPLGFMTLNGETRIRVTTKAGAPLLKGILK